MRDISISEFKTKCFDLVDQVYRTRRPLRITRRGVPVAILAPSSHRRRLKFVLGDMIGTAEIVGDIVLACDRVERDGCPLGLICGRFP